MQLSWMYNGKSIAQRKKIDRIRVHSIKKWSCNFARDKKQEPIREFVNSLNIQDPINV